MKILFRTQKKSILLPNSLVWRKLEKRERFNHIGIILDARYSIYANMIRITLFIVRQCCPYYLFQSNSKKDPFL